MITAMRRLDLLLYHREKDSFLHELQELGVVHIVETPDKNPSSLQEVEDRIRKCEHLLKIFSAIAPETLPAQRTDADPAAVIAEFEKLETSDAGLEQELQHCQRDQMLLAPWGEFDFGLVTRLRLAGLSIRFYRAEPKKFVSLTQQELTIALISRSRHRVFFMALNLGEVPAVDADELLLPERPLSAVTARIEEIKRLRRDMDHARKGLAAYRDMLADFAAGQQNLRRQLSARLDLQDHAQGMIVSLTGWLPADKEQGVARFLDSFCAWRCFYDPAPDDDVPVLLKNDRFTRLFEPITKLFSLPNYGEFDPTPFFAPFFALYVGLCMGDIAYGVIIFIAAAILHARVGKPLKPLWKLIMVLGASTTASGLLLNSFFGQTLFGGQNIPQGSALLPWGARYFSPLTPVPGARGTIYPMMSFALLLGVMQVVVALLLRTAGRLRHQGLIAGLLPISYIMCLAGAFVWGAATDFMHLGISSFAVGPLKIGPLLAAVPLPAGKALLFGGLAIMFLFNNPDKKVVVRLPLGLWELFGFATGMFSDILSYLRLFALGLCGGMLGASFNMLATRIITTNGIVDYASPLVLVSALIFVAGHALNLTLSIVGSFVHPLRLTFVEFYKNLDFQGGGRPYTPFAALKLGSGTLKSKT